MPAVAALPFVIIALLAVILVYATAYFGKAVIAILPTSGFPGIGLLRNLIATGIYVATSTIENLFAPIMIPIVNLITAPVAAVKLLVGSIESAISEAASSLRYIVTVSIPAVYRWAENYTNALINAVETYARSLAATLSHDMSVLYYRAVAVGDASVSAVKTYAVNGFAAVRTDLSTVYYDAIGVAAVATANVKTYAVNGFATARANTDDVYHKATAYTDATFGKVDGYVNQQVAAGLAVAETTAIHAAQILVTDVEHAATTAIAATWPDVVAGVTGAAGAIGGGLDDILAGLKGIDLAIPTDIAGIAAATGALAIPMLRYLEECGIPNCRNLSGLGRDLQALLNIVEDGSILALVVGLIADPAGAAQALDNDLSSLADDTIGAAKSLFGVG